MNFKRIVIGVVILCMLTTCIPNENLSVVHAESATDVIDFVDEFDGTELNTEAWSYATTGLANVTNGMFIMKNGRAHTNIVADAANWNNYVIETDVTLSDETIGKNRAADVAIYQQKEERTSGYVFRLFSSDQNNTTVRLYKDGTSMKSASCTLSIGQSYHVKVSAQTTESGTNIKCYVDNELYIDYTDTASPYTKGYAGVVVSDNITASYANFSVKNLNEENELFRDDFSADSLDTTNAWKTAVGTGGSVSPSDSKLGMKNGYAYLSNKSDASTWKNYLIETEVSLSDGTSTSTRAASIVIYGQDYGWLTSAGGYAFRLYFTSSSTTLRLEKNGELISDDYSKSYTLAENTNYRVKVVAQTMADATWIACYLDEQLIFTYKDTDSAYTQGIPGLVVSNNVTANFENISVEKLDLHDSVLYEEFDGSSLSENTWYAQNASSGSIAVANGEVTMKNGYAYASAITGATSWKDYVVETEVVLSDYTESTNRAASVVVYAQSASWLNQSGGYAFRLFLDSNNSTTLRLYKDNAAKCTVTYPLEKNGSYNVKVSAKTKSDVTIVRCYINDELVITYKDSDSPYTQGFPGVVMTDNMTVAYKNLIVKNLCADLEGCSVTLDGNIGLNFFMSLDETVTTDKYAVMRFSHNGVVQDVPMADALDTENGYKFICEVAAKEMADTITAQIFRGDKAISDAFECSVQEYAGAMIADGTYDANAVALAKAMLNYGAYAQTYFNYNVKNLANSNLNAGDQAVSSVNATTLENYAKTDTQSNSIGTLAGSSLVLESETTLKFYFTLDKDINDLTFKVGDEEVEAATATNETYYYVAVENIAAHNLNAEHTVVVTNGEETLKATYNVMTYCYNVLSRERDEKLQNLVRALYLYNAAADVYWEGVN